MRDLSMHVLDIVQNSIKAGAKLIAVSFVRSPDGILTFTVKDDGCGMSPEFLARVDRPLYHHAHHAPGGPRNPDAQAERGSCRRFFLP